MIFDWRTLRYRGGSGWRQPAFVVTYVGIVVGAAAAPVIRQINIDGSYAPVVNVSGSSAAAVALDGSWHPAINLDGTMEQP